MPQNILLFKTILVCVILVFASQFLHTKPFVTIFDFFHSLSTVCSSDLAHQAIREWRALSKEYHIATRLKFGRHPSRTKLNIPTMCMGVHMASSSGYNTTSSSHMNTTELLLLPEGQCGSLKQTRECAHGNIVKIVQKTDW